MIDAGYRPGCPIVTTLLGAVTYSRHKDCLTLYDSGGNKWRCSGVSLPTSPLTWVHRLATLCFINPVRPCVLDWSNPRPYDFREIMDIVRQEILEDDDILTQWQTEDKCLEMVERATDLRGLVATYRRLTRTRQSGSSLFSVE